MKDVFELYLAPSKKKVPATAIGNIVRSQKLCPTEKQLSTEIAKAGISGTMNDASCVGGCQGRW